MKSDISQRDFLVFGKPLIGEDEIDEVVDSLRSGWLGTGRKVKYFEDQFNLYKKSKFSVAVNSCTAALHLSILSLELKEGDEIITTPMTFCATINSIIHSGAIPVLADIDSGTMNIDPAKIREKITKKTRAIVPVHFAGRACEMNSIMEIAKENNLYVIEDCAHAVETKYQGLNVGTIGDFGCFSFYVTKNIVTGEGGMVVSNDENKINYIRKMALHGMSKDAWKRFSDEGYQHYYVEFAGYKYKMMDIQAAIGIHQLKNIERNWQRRQKIWNYYNSCFEKLSIEIPSSIKKEDVHGYHLYTIMVDKKREGLSRDEFLNKMHEKNIGTGVHYLSIPEHPFYQKKYNWTIEDYPIAKQVGRSTVSLPLGPQMSDDDIDLVVDSVKSLLN